MKRIIFVILMCVALVPLSLYAQPGGHGPGGHGPGGYRPGQPVYRHPGYGTSYPFYPPFGPGWFFPFAYNMFPPPSDYAQPYSQYSYPSQRYCRQVWKKNPGYDIYWGKDPYSGQEYRIPGRWRSETECY